MERKPGDPAGGFSGKKTPESVSIRDPGKAAVDHFYEKLAKLNESSGLSSVSSARRFNLRETMLDLHQLYREVIKRGGFYQVTKFGKWGDVASASNLKSSLSMSAAQLHNIYEILLLQYELMYCRKMPQVVNTWPNKSFKDSGLSQSYSTEKRKHCDESSISFPKESNNNKKIKNEVDAPLKPRTAYHIFLRLEINRLRVIYGETRSDTQNLRDMAIDAWRCLSDKDKQPYIEASVMDKERYDKEMAAHHKQIENRKINVTGEGQSVGPAINPTDEKIMKFPKEESVHLENKKINVNGERQSVGPSINPNDERIMKFPKEESVYRVCLEGDESEEVLSQDECHVMELAVEEMKNARSISNDDPIFHIEWGIMP
ncbi:hypothetical protein ABFS83_02G091400 [Erythranthe nasuta]